jgi:hypothetical protein
MWKNKTRAGDIVVITYNVESENQMEACRVIALIECQDTGMVEAHYYYPDGRYRQDIDTGMDLIKQEG